MRRMVMPKKLKELAVDATENPLTVRIQESANQVWLAGLGAFSKAEQEGVKMFEALVAEGEKVDERMKAAADEGSTEMREKATGIWDKVEKVFEDWGTRALHSLNVPSHKDIENLSKRVHELTAIRKRRTDEEETQGRGRAHSGKAA
jgi:poly(hydroxyalkanoate) granule-associated protein